MSQKLANLSKAQKTRLEFIEFLLRFRGWLTRKDVTENFDTGLAGTSKDIATYRANTLKEGSEHDSANFCNNESLKRYEIEDESFTPLFSDLTYDKVLNFLRVGAIKDKLGAEEPLSIGTPPRLGEPDIDILSFISRAILNKTALEIRYHALSSGDTTRVVYPHSIVDTGLKWHMRAYCTKRERFSDFIISRIHTARLVEGHATKSEGIESDEQWNRKVRLKLAAHPNRDNLQNPETIEHEYKMENGFKEVIVRAAVAGYWLQLWNVDCSFNHSLKGKEYQLWLSNVETLYDVSNALLAPGYTKPNDTN